MTNLTRHTIRELLYKFSQKAVCRYTERKADKLLIELRSLIPFSECVALSTAHGHFLLGEGPDEVTDLCHKLIAKYSNYEG